MKAMEVWKSFTDLAKQTQEKEVFQNNIENKWNQNQLPNRSSMTINTITAASWSKK